MYKLVIVEDEREVRRRLAGLVEKSGCNFEVIAEYETGIDAYDGILLDNPDLILTDIKIPYINGIELSKKIRDVYPLVKIIIVTGYSEFDYAKEAANLGVIGFISKPVTAQGIRDLLKKAEASLDEEFLTDSNLNKLTSFYQDNLPTIRESDLYQLAGMSEVMPAFEQKLRSNNVSLDYPYFVMCVFDFDKLPGDGDDTARHELAFSSIRKSIGKELGDLFDFDLFSHYESLCLMLKSQSEPDLVELERRIESIIQRVGKFSDMPVSAGISSFYHNNKNFSAMVKEAKRSLEYRSVMGGGKVFSFGNTQSTSLHFSFNENLIRELGYLLHTHALEDCIERIDVIRENISSTQNSLYYAATGILNVLIRSCDDLEGLYASSGDPDMLYRKLFEIKTDTELYDYLKTVLRLIRKLNDNVIVDNVERNLRLIESYIQTHYCDPDISFESLAREVNFSVSYISAILKKKRNTSFVKMLTELRMEKAKDLLTNPGLKIVDVAEQLGYNDPYYFSHCFKKHFGLPPTKFRSNEQS